ncbi:MAG: cell division protein ZapA [Zoogloeaceae bacterium]|nr:cell division protein ZapA [Zoogloeaceae bacterium]
MSETQPLDVNIMGREYRIACPVGQESTLRAAIDLVEQKMKETASRSRSNMPERVAVLAAVNIASDYLEKDYLEKATPSSGNTKNSAAVFDSNEVRRRIEAMDARLGAFLERQ